MNKKRHGKRCRESLREYRAFRHYSGGTQRRVWPFDLQSSRSPVLLPVLASSLSVTMRLPQCGQTTKKQIFVLHRYCSQVFCVASVLAVIGSLVFRLGVPGVSFDIFFSYNYMSRAFFADEFMFYQKKCRQAVIDSWWSEVNIPSSQWYQLVFLRIFRQGGPICQKRSSVFLSYEIIPFVVVYVLYSDLLHVLIMI